MKNKRKARKITSLVLALFLAIIISVMMIAVSFRIGICNKDIFIQNMFDNTYYESLYEDMQNRLKLALWEASLPVSLADGVLQDSQVYIDGKNYINSVLNGKEPKSNTAKIEEKLTQNIESYLKENKSNADIAASKIEEIVNTVAADYKNSTAFLSADYFYQYQIHYVKVTNILLIAGTALCFIIIVMLLEMYHRKYRALRYVVYAVTTSTVVNTLYTAHLTKMLTVGNMISESGNYYQMVENYLIESSRQGYYVSLAGVVLTATLLLLIKVTKKKYR